MTVDLNLVKANLALDNVSSSKAIIYADPLFNIGQWTNANQVPRHIYTSLTDLCSGHGLTLDQVIVCREGVAETPASVAIILEPSALADSVGSGFLENDAIGAQYMEIDILVKNVRTSGDITLTRDIGLRIRYILDHLVRGDPANQFSNANSAGPDLFIIGDNAIYPGTECKMRWLKSDVLRVAQQYHRYCLDYTLFMVPFS